MASSWTTRAETPADVPAVRDVVGAAFPTAEEAGLVDALRVDPGAWIEGLSVVAVDDDDRPVGHALLTRCHIGDAPALCLAPVAVRPDAQRTGAGSAAVRAAERRGVAHGPGGQRAAGVQGEGHHGVVGGGPDGT